MGFWVSKRVFLWLGITFIFAWSVFLSASDPVLAKGETEIGAWYSVWYAKSTATTTSWISGHGTGSDVQFLADVNGDGFDDALVCFTNNGDWYVSKSTGASFENYSLWRTGFGVGADKLFVSDVDGDGDEDALCFVKDSGNWYVALSDGVGSFGKASLWASKFGIHSDTQLLADCDGDGKSDAISYTNNAGSWHVALSSGSSFEKGTQWKTGFGMGSSKQFASDISGDGKADAITYEGSLGNWDAAFAEENKFGNSFRWISGHGVNSSRQMVEDGNNDGLADAYVVFTVPGDFNGDWYVVQSNYDLNGNFGHFPAQKFNDGFGGGADNHFVGDVGHLGDEGWKEVVSFDGHSGQWEVQPYRFTKQNLYNTWKAWNIKYEPYVKGAYQQYDSGDPEVIDEHLAEFADAQIDFMIMDQTNNIYVDDGYIYNRAQKVARRIDLWNDNTSNKAVKYLIAIGGIQWSEDPKTIEFEAGEVWEKFVNTQEGGIDNYVYKDGKPMLIIYCQPKQRELWEKYTGDKTNTDRFAIRWAHSPSVSGTYGWEVRNGTIDDDEVMVVMPGWNNNKGEVPVARAQGDYYALSCWNKVLEKEKKPEFVIINSFNEFAEETSVEVADTSKVGGATEKWINKGGVPEDSMYWELTKKYIEILKTEEYKGEDTFSGGQGWYKWQYLQKEDNHYSPLSWNGANHRWLGNQPYCIVAPGWMHPDANDAARSWTAPRSGSVAISGHVGLENNHGDGVNVSIMKGEAVVWGPMSIMDTLGLNYSLTVDVNKGDVIYFIVNKNETAEYDTTFWTPRISYE